MTNVIHYLNILAKFLNSGDKVDLDTITKDKISLKMTTLFENRTIQ
jgi:hypothetical protein